MKDPVKEQERNLKLIMAIIGILIFSISLYFAIYDIYLEATSLKVNGKITDIKVVDDKNKATVKFRLNGHDYEAIVTPKSDLASVDDKITIKVNMYDPTKEVINNHYFIYVPGLLISIVFLILSLPYLIKYTKKINYQKKLKKAGLYVNATITEVFLNNNPKLKKNGAYPYRLRAKYFNPQNQTEYVFESEDTYIDLNDPINEYKKTSIVVYINPAKIDKYYVDLNDLYPPLELIDPIAIMGPKTEIKFRFGTKAKEEYEREQAEKQAQEQAAQEQTIKEGETAAEGEQIPPQNN